MQGNFPLSIISIEAITSDLSGKFPRKFKRQKTVRKVKNLTIPRAVFLSVKNDCA